MDKKLLDIICCPTTKLPLELLSAEKLDTLNAAILAGDTWNQAEVVLTEALSEALITRDGRRVYPVRDGIPILLEEECIDWNQMVTNRSAS
jgi:uncharacterized protein YbaR (Trm112 family)